MAKDLSRYVKTKLPLDEFTQKVIRLIISIPRGRVATYGQIAELAGKPSHSRYVGFILRTITYADRVPWQRVLGANGRVSFPKRNRHHKLQKRLLAQENVFFEGERLNLKRYRWRKGGVRPRMFSW